MYLVDTNVISAAAPSKAVSPTALMDWMEQQSLRLFLSVVSVAEIEAGIAQAERKGAPAKAQRLAAWLDTILHLYGDRVLPLDPPAARAAGRLADLARSRGLDPGFADLTIAGTALIRGHVVLTRNLRHFAAIDVPAHDPFASLPDARAG